MKLTIRRGQSDVKGLFGGHKGVQFSFYAKVDITDEERSLIDQYKVGEYVLASYEIPLGSEKKEINLSVQNLVDGSTTDMDRVSDLLKLEEDIKDSCHVLKDLLLVMSTFGGEETFEI